MSTSVLENAQQLLFAVCGRVIVHTLCVIVTLILPKDFFFFFFSFLFHLLILFFFFFYFVLLDVRVQQRNGRKSWTTVQGLNSHLDRVKIEKLLKHFKKTFNCNGTIVSHNEYGEVIQLQGDHRDKVEEFLLKEKIIDKDLIKVHGF